MVVRLFIKKTKIFVANDTLLKRDASYDIINFVSRIHSHPKLSIVIIGYTCL